MINLYFLDGEKDNIEDALTVRKKVFIEEQNIPETIEIDGTDKNSKLILLKQDYIPFATGRIIEINEKLYIGRIAILKEYRMLGFGKILVELLIDEAKKLGHNTIYLNSQKNVIQFYEKIGFKPIGEEFFKAGIPHLHMKKTF